MNDWKFTIAENFPLLVGAVGHATEFTKAAFIPVASAILTSVVMSGMTADKVAVRLEERIAAHAVRIEACEKAISVESEKHSGLRERIATCEARLPPQPRHDKYPRSDP